MPDWLTARPVAHRGLHDAANGVIENTPSAFEAAIAGNYAIECDLQLSADGEAMVHHDDVLGRLTEGTGRLDAVSATDLKRVPFKASQERMLTLGDLCALVAGRVPLVIELKSRFDGDARLPRRAAAVLKDYQGPAAVMSFDPGQVGALRDFSPRLTRGLVAWRPDRARERNPATGSAARFVLQAVAARLQFLAYRVSDLPSPVPGFARNVLGLPLLTWTVRTAEDRQRAVQYADQIIFEGFRPE
jgi:glycerophosphoryl diester phosphodiesterase